MSCYLHCFYHFSPHQPNPLLKVDSLSIKFKTGKKDYVNAVSKVNFTINKGETLALVGESGCGKSVTSLSIMRLISNSVGKIDGKIIFKDTDLNQLSERKMRSIRGKDNRNHGIS